MDKPTKEEINTGSINYQIVSLRKEIINLQTHLAKNKTLKRKGNGKDIPAKRALLKKVARVRRFVRYLEKNRSCTKNT